VHPELENLAREIAPEVQSRLAERAPHMVGAAAPAPTPTPTPTPAGPSPQLVAIENGIRSLLDISATIFGAQAVALIASDKPAFRRIFGETFLEAVDKAIHALKDAQPQAGA
jgi:hypothetical protein